MVVVPLLVPTIPLFTRLPTLSVPVFVTASAAALLPAFAFTVKAPLTVSALAASVM